MDAESFRKKVADIEALSEERPRTRMKRLIRQLVWSLIESPDNRVFLLEADKRWGKLFSDDPIWELEVRLIPLNASDPNAEPTIEQLRELSSFEYTLHRVLLRYVGSYPDPDCDRGLRLIHRARLLMPRLSPLRLRGKLYEVTTYALDAFDRELFWREWNCWTLCGTMLLRDTVNAPPDPRFEVKVVPAKEP